MCLTLVLTIVQKFMDFLQRETAGAVGKVLFVKLAEQGSTVLAFGAILRAVERVGSENVYFLVFE
jgi:hypothetical protein